MQRAKCLIVLVAIFAVDSLAEAGSLANEYSNLPEEIDEFLDTTPPSLDPRNNDWGAFVAVYGWLAGVKGDVVEGDSTPIDIPFEEFLDATDTGFQMYVEIRWRNWFLAFDGTWATLAFGEDTALVDVDITINQKLFDLKLGYRVWSETLEEIGESNPWGREIVLDAFIGARYFLTDIRVTATPIVGAPIVIETRDERVDPFLGLRFGWQFTQRWGIAVRGDIGGFGIGEAAQFSWQFGVNVAFRFTRNLSAFLGYRLLAYDTVTGSGADRSGTDLLQHGPQFGVGFTW